MIIDITIVDISIFDMKVNQVAREQLQNLTESMYYMLLSLTSPRHGYGIMQWVKEQTQERVPLGAGTLYALLARFEKEKIIKQVEEEGRKKVYLLTEKGREILNEEYLRLKQLVKDGKELMEGTENAE